MPPLSEPPKESLCACASRQAADHHEGRRRVRFVNDIHHALQLAGDAAADRDIRLGGGVSVIRQYRPRASLTRDVATAPLLLGSGEHLLYRLDLPALGYERTEHVPTDAATHIVFVKRRQR